MLALKHNWNLLCVSVLASSMGGRGFKACPHFWWLHSHNESSYAIFICRSCELILKNPVFDVIIGCRMRNMHASASKFHAVHVRTLNKVCAM